MPSPWPEHLPAQRLWALGSFPSTVGSGAMGRGDWLPAQPEACMVIVHWALWITEPALPLPYPLSSSHAGSFSTSQFHLEKNPCQRVFPKPNFRHSLSHDRVLSLLGHSARADSIWFTYLLESLQSIHWARFMPGTVVSAEGIAARKTDWVSVPLGHTLLWVSSIANDLLSPQEQTVVYPAPHTVPGT